MAGIYIHIPFCRQKCHYCDFYSTAAVSLIEPMITAIGQELDDRCDFLGGEPVETLYIGGGTPSLCSHEQLGRLIDKVRELWEVNNFAELTVEANPDDLTEQYLEGLVEIGVNRLSIGIQSFIDDHLKFMNRRHTAAEAVDAVRRAKAAGFANITVDLIYGLDGMTVEQWNYNIDRALELDVPHISAYHLTIEPRTVFGKRNIATAPEEVGIEHYNLLDSRLSEAGYDHYEVSNFAKSGFEALHNGNYWRGIPYLGVGPSAHSYNGNSRVWNTADSRKYMQNREFEEEALSPADKLNEYIMISLRTAKGVDIRYVTEKFGSAEAGSLINRAEKYLATGDLYHTEYGFAIPVSRWLISDYIIGDLFI